MLNDLTNSLTGIKSLIRHTYIFFTAYILIVFSLFIGYTHMQYKDLNDTITVKFDQISSQLEQQNKEFNNKFEARLKESNEKFEARLKESEEKYQVQLKATERAYQLALEALKKASE
jgi:predicted negative regulator of RcsB-dependent stress response